MSVLLSVFVFGLCSALCSEYGFDFVSVFGFVSVFV